jgi:hypothetical protein
MLRRKAITTMGTKDHEGKTCLTSRRRSIPLVQHCRRRRLTHIIKSISQLEFQMAREERVQ